MINGFRFTGICDLDIESLLTEMSGFSSSEHLDFNLMVQSAPRQIAW